MRLWYWLYLNLKRRLKEFPMTILYMLGLPLGIGLLMGNIMDILFENPNVIDPLHIEIIDEDQSELSNQLINFLDNDSMQNYLLLSNDSPNVSLIIPTGYEQAILAGSGGTLTLEEEGINMVTASLEMVQGILNQYHEQLMLNLSPDASDLTTLIYQQSSVISTYIDTPLQMNSMSFYSIGLMGFLLVMLIMNFTSSSYKNTEIGLEKRYYSAPISRLRMLHYDLASNGLYCFLILCLYVLIYRALGYSFLGPIHLLLPILIGASFFIISAAAFISNIFSVKYGTLMINLLLFIQIIFGQIFIPTENLPNLSPTYFITEMFQNYVLEGTWTSIQMPLFMTLIISFLLYGMTCLKEKYHFWGV